MSQLYDVVVIGGGQAGLATAYYLRRAKLNFVILDAESEPGAGWLHTWDSLRLCSPAGFSSLPGWMMPETSNEQFPGRQEVLNYLTQYEARYQFPIERPVQVTQVQAGADGLVVAAGDRQWHGRAVVSATGTYRRPFIPEYPGMSNYAGEQLHSAAYRSPHSFSGKRVLVVGGGNSGAQILAEVSTVANATWVTLTEPAFLADDVDGRVLFARASARVLQEDDSPTPIGGIGDIVMVPSVKDARERGVLKAVRPFSRFTPTGVVWPDGREEAIDVVIWCTGFRPVLDHLQSLGVIEDDGKVDLHNNQARRQPRLWLTGYGDWAGAASATLVGAGRTAKEMVPSLVASLQQ